MNCSDRYDWKTLKPQMRGHWQRALIQLCGVDAKVLNGKHQSCPACGGKDRFRFTDKIGESGERGDGAAYCSVCGAGDGITWVQKLSKWEFSDCVNEIGRFLHGTQQSELITTTKRINRLPDYDYGARMTHEEAEWFLSECRIATKTPVTLLEGIAPDSLSVALVAGENGSEGALRSKLAVPLRMVQKDGIDDELCNVALIGGDHDVSFMAGRMTFGAVTLTGANQGSAIYLASDWFFAWHVHHATGAEVWCTWKPSNSELVCQRYTGSRELRFACNPGDFDDLAYAEQCDKRVIIPDERGVKFGMQRKLFAAGALLDGGQTISRSASGRGQSMG